ncbi:MAG: sugar transferase [Candidatus Eisenbacteria bacterium]|nr:sugar transferase [Candidatus Latescibacterota bacterium]MBD3301662.1 sugar transferase [Candidatus Eisenbacteria bacterium]
MRTRGGAGAGRGRVSAVRSRVDDLGLGPLPTEPATGFYARVGKPALDRVGATLGLLACVPLLLLCSVAIRLEGRGSVFFRQERIGLLGRPFRVWKLRTMVPNAERLGTGLLVQQDDPRVTRVGRILRATSLDELPQLLNVVRGEMSLVGPRPTVASQVRQYDAFQRQRLRLRPGMTGLAQIRGRKSLTWEERIRLDVAYLERLSLAADLRILAGTVRVVLGAKDPPAKADYWGESARGETGEDAP